MPIATNGTHIESPEKNLDDVDDEYRQEFDRPADVIEDMRQMGQRQRVKTILNSKEFRDELEEIITDALKHGPHPASLIALQQISELLLPHTSRWTTVSSLSRAGGSVIVPINDIRGVDSQGYSKSERLLRCKLASLYRLVDLFGWSQGIYNHITARVNQEQEHFLINPFGLMYHEVTGSSLVKVDIAGNIIDPGSTTYGINRAGYTLHSAIHKARPDLKCVIHLHTPSVAAVSAMKCGLLPLSQDALFCGKISYHDYRGILIEDDVKKLLVEDLGPINKVMILRNHGFVACGETIEEAWKYAYNVINACEVQVRAVPLGIDQLYLPSNEQQKRIADVLQGNLNEATGDKKWKIGEIEFESLMRILDNAGFRTGYVYRQPLIRTIDKTTTFKDIEVPPAASSATSFVEQIHPEAYSPTRQVQRTTEWRNSPNAYLKQEIEETGTPNPKKVTKWVPDTALKHSTPIKIDTKHQFAPSNVNPKELKSHQKQIKEDRFNEKVSAGYQSKILDNAAWDDVSQMKDPHQPSSEAVVVVGAASKGIIKRDQQNNAIVYKTYYGQNPFAHMDNDEIEKYKREVEQNQMREQGGDSQYDDQSDSRVKMQRQDPSRTLSSSDESLSRVSIHSGEQTNEHTLPLNIIPSSIIRTTQRTIHTQTIKETRSSSVPSKSNPSFAETQLLSVYYPSENPKTSLTNDKCIYVERQDRQPIRYRTAYNPSSTTKSMQTSSPSSSPLSTDGSTLIIHGNNDNKSKYDQYFKIHSGNQHLSTNSNDQPNELIEQTKYSYEEYIINQNRTTSSSSSSSSSVTTVIAQNEELDSDQTSHLTFHDTNTQSSTSSTLTNQKLSNWPPVPDEVLLKDNDEQKRPSRVQFAEQLVHVIPVSTTNSLTDETNSPPPIIPRKNFNDSDIHQPIHQSKWIKTHMDNSDIQINSTTNRVDTLRSLFEQQTITNQTQRIEPEEKPSKHGVEIRFRINDRNIYHAEPAKILPHIEQASNSNNFKEKSPFKLEDIEQIIGKSIKNLDDIGHYLSDGCTWQWNEIFWLSLTTSQRDQLKQLEQKVLSRENSFDPSSSSNETKKFKSTTSITEPVSVGQQNKPQTSTSAITKYTEINTIDKNQTSVNVFNTTSNSNSMRNNSQESLSSSSLINPNKRTDSQITIIESGYNSSDEQQKFRINSKPIIENLSIEKNPSEQLNIHPLSYEQFIIDYLSQYSKQIRSNNGTLILLIDGQQIPISNKILPLSNENFILEKNIYLDIINQDFLPFETELNELIIFISDETILIPSDRWIIYRKKYQQAQWIEKLKRINRNIPLQLIPIIEQWLSNHITIELNTKKLNIDGLIIPLIGRLGLHLLDSYHNRQLQTNYWNNILKYLIHIGYISYDIKNKLIYIDNIELDCQHLLKSSSSSINENETEDHIQYLTEWLEQLNEQKLIEITDNNDIIIYPNNPEQQIFIKHEHIDQYMSKKSTSIENDIINMNDIAHVLYLNNYVQYSSNQFIYRNQIIQLDSNEYLWLLSIIHSIRIIEHIQQTEIELFDGENTRIIQIPYQSMLPTKDKRIIADYLFQNGHIQFDTDKEHYVYRYTAPDEKIPSNEHELLSSHIRRIHIDKINQEIQIEFSHDQNHILQLPSNWYEDISEHNFDRSYIIDMLFKYGGKLSEDYFLFNNHQYLLKSSLKEKESLIDYYVEFINNQDGIKYDHTKNLLLLENPLDHTELYLTHEHTEFIKKNQYRRRDMKDLLTKSSSIKQDEFNNWLLYYNNQCIQLPIPNQLELINQFHKTIDYMYKHNLIIYNQQLNILQIHFINYVLTIPKNQIISINNSSEISQWLLKNSDGIIPSSEGYIQLIYQNQLYKLPLIEEDLKLLFPFHKSLRFIEKSSSTTTLDIEQPTKENNYTIDPLLILANYIYRAATIYQDNFGRLVIRLNKDEIVVPYNQAINSIQAINTSPNRTGTIIARLIFNIGKIQSNQQGGIIINIGKKSIELTKNILDQSKTNLNASNENLTLYRIPSNDSINEQKIKSSSSLSLKPRLLIIHGDQINSTTRYYIQYTYENDRKLNSIMMLPTRYPIRPEKPQLILPEHYQDKSLRDASVYVYNSNSNEIFYENLAQYLSTNQTDLSSYTVRHMLKFSSSDEYFHYLKTYMSINNAKQLVEESQQLNHPISSNFSNIRIRTPDRELNQSSNLYNVKNGTMISESNKYEQEHDNYASNTIERTSSSSSSLSSDMLISSSNRNIPISQYV